MIHYTNEQLASIIALPIVSILLVWTTAIFQKNRKKWGPYDIPIVSLLILSILRNFTILTYTLFVTLNQNTIDIDYCSGIIWIFNSIHTFQACALTTLAIIGLFSIKLRRKQAHIRQFLTPTHLIYHLFCLTTLCACVGVAALLARSNRHTQFVNVTVFDSNPCKFMPFDLDIKYNVFIIVLNVFLASVSLFAFVGICFNHIKYMKNRRNGQFDYMQKSNSDLSDLSMNNTEQHQQQQHNKNYYDTYTIQRGPGHHHEFYDNNNMATVACIWNSDVSNVSNTVSSTNSRRPCLTNTTSSSVRACAKEEERTGLETIHPVLIVCYLFYHLPIIALCSYPQMLAPWPIAGIALWLGLVQDLLIPIGLSIVDARFCKWVSNVYKCSERGNDKLPHVGLDGKFRPFSSPPALSMDNNPHLRPLQTIEHRFPITNGSLYTSIDGRLPVIHNYRRHNKEQPKNGKSSEAPPTRHDSNACRNCATDLCPSHSNLHHLSPHYINKQLNLIQTSNSNFQLANKAEKSTNSYENYPIYHNHHANNTTNNNPELIIKNSRNLVRLNKMRLCKSEDSLAEVAMRPPAMVDSSTDDDDYMTEAHNFDTLSSQSSYSITTEANCDFDFFQKPPPLPKAPPPKLDHQHHHHHNNLMSGVQRSSSKRSLENWYTNIEIVPKIQRSNSFMTVEDRERAKARGLVRSTSKLSDYRHPEQQQRNKSSDYIGPSNTSLFIEDVFYFNYPNRSRTNLEQRKFVGSAPDLKKIFISEYI